MGGRNNVEKVMKERQKELKKMINHLTREIANSPQGSLRIQCKRGKPQYYWRQTEKDRTGRYLKKNELKIASALAQKGYDEKVIGSAKEEAKAIQKFLDTVPDVCAEEVFSQFNDKRQQIIKPVYDPDEMYVAKWLKTEYEKKPFMDGEALFETDNGERVRSKSELMIANTLKRMGIPYRYEFPIRLKGSPVALHPDFYVLNVRLRKVIIFEHFGLIDDRDYRDAMIERIRLYAANGIFPGENFVFTFETSRHPLSTKDVERIAEHYFL